MLNKTLFLLCGVPGSGKTWVIGQVKDKYTHISHDIFTRAQLVFLARTSDKWPIIIDCPFAEREFRDQLLDASLNVIPIFIVEEPDIVRARYESREKKPVAANVLTRALTIQNRAIEWNAKYGTSSEILAHLKSL